MKIRIADDEIAYLRGSTGTLALARTLGRHFFLETDREEIVLFTDPDDLIVASSFGTGEAIERGLRCTIFHIRELGSPLIVLPKGHPASPRLRVVVSVGKRTRLSCRIQPGTHPEQDVLCGAEEMDGVEIHGTDDGAELVGFEGEVHIEKL
ncbi:MAG: hypothetical protein QHG98_00695 [Methanothrix sp.]|jgi:hypothetical protein|uniref:hypothetical protein n=1 Tax=Methanothrix sp. TaxID=90426 RepID=UPI00247D9D5F|nr:hypothetical protein [Methanothrix sp.]